jgi:hypothetical protein
MRTRSYAVADSATMLRRQLRHLQRYVSVTVLLVGMPVGFLLVFVYVFGGTLGAGLGRPAGGRATYLEYVTPGILLMAVAPDPGAHLTPATEAPGVAPHHQEGLLDDLVGQARVGGALTQPHQQPGGVLVVQDPERLRVPLGHRRQQLGVGRDPIGVRAHA